MSRECGEKLAVLLIELSVLVGVQNFNDANRPAVILQWDGENRLGPKPGHLVDLAGEPGIPLDIVYQQRLAMLHDPAGDALSRFQPDHLQLGTDRALSHHKHQFLSRRVEEQQAAVFRSHQLA